MDFDRYCAEIVTQAELFATELADADDSGPLPASWLVDGASALREVWVPFHYRTTSFYARRFTHETLVHRADATLAAGLEFRASPEVVLDAIDEWMELESLPLHFEFRPEKREILGSGRSVGFESGEHAWFLGLDGPVVTWERGRRGAAVTVRGSLTNLLLALYQREDAEDVVGDLDLFKLWQTHVRFG